MGYDTVFEISFLKHSLQEKLQHRFKSQDVEQIEYNGVRQTLIRLWSFKQIMEDSMIFSTQLSDF